MPQLDLITIFNLILTALVLVASLLKTEFMILVATNDPIGFVNYPSICITNGVYKYFLTNSIFIKPQLP